MLLLMLEKHFLGMSMSMKDGRKSAKKYLKMLPALLTA